MQKISTICGVICLVLSIVSFVYQGIDYTKEEQVVKLGNMEITAQQKKSIPLHPILGGVFLVSGIILIYIGTKK